MQTAKELSVSLVNKPGRLATMLDALNKGKVNLRALVVMDSGTRGTVRLVPDNMEAASTVLDKMNLDVEISDVLLVEVSRQSGAFGRICERLASEHLNIDYAYLSFSAEHGAKGGGVAIVRVNDLNKAQRILGESTTNNHRRKQRQQVRRAVATY